MIDEYTYYQVIAERKIESLQAKVEELTADWNTERTVFVKRIADLEAALITCKNAALPDHYDEREWYVRWLQDTILDATRKGLKEKDDE